MHAIFLQKKSRQKSVIKARESHIEDADLIPTIIQITLMSRKIICQNFLHAQNMPTHYPSLNRNMTLKSFVNCLH